MTGNHYVLSLLSDVALFFIVFLLIFTFRGFSKALAAKLLGDNTPQQHEQLSLNPLAHVDILGLIIIVIGFFFLGSMLPGIIPRSSILLICFLLGIQWTYPVQINDANFKHYRLYGIMSALAGPLSCFLLAFLALTCIKFINISSMPHNILVTIVNLLNETIYLSIWFGVLDLTPIPPFDGGIILGYLLPYSKQHIIETLEEYSLYIILALFFLPGVRDVYLGTLSTIAELIRRFMFTILF